MSGEIEVGAKIRYGGAEALVIGIAGEDAWVEWLSGAHETLKLSWLTALPDTLMVELPRETVEALAKWQPEGLGKYWNSVVAASIKAMEAP